MALPDGAGRLGVLRAVSLLGGVAVIVFDVVMDLMAPAEPELTHLRLTVGLTSCAYFLGTYVSDYMRQHAGVWIMLLVALFTGTWLYNCYLSAFSFPVTITLFNVVLGCSLVFESPRVTAYYLTFTMFGVIVALLSAEQPAINPTIMLTAFFVTCGLCYFVLGSWLRSQAEVQRNEEELNKTQVLAQVGGWTQIGNQIELSQNARALLGLSGTVRQDWAQLQTLLDPPSSKALDAAVAQAQFPGQGFDIEVCLDRDNNNIQWLRVLGEVSRGPKQLLRGMIQDISRQKRHEAELVQAKDLAEQALATRSRFLANMSHEIRTPMNGVIGMASMLRTAELTPEQKEMVDTIYSSGASLLTIINDILDFSKIDAGRMELEAAPFSLRELVHQTVELFTPRATEKNLPLLTSVSDHVPEMLVGDAIRLRQILSNLIANAIKFTETGSIEVEVGGEFFDIQTFNLVLVVRDTGIGISPDQQVKLFDAFTQADLSTTRLYGGTGLGLSICRHLVDLMGGQLSVDSQLNQGSSFRVAASLSVPASDGIETADFSSKEVDGTSETFDTADTRSDTRILLVEDNPVNQKVAIKMLERLGLQADLAENGLEAVRSAKSQSYDLLFMDVQMPVMDGLTATKRIRAELEGPQPYIVALTANAMNGDAEQYLEAGMNAHLAKPVTLESLRVALAEFAVHAGHG